MKKKNYLEKAEQGVLIGTSFLLLNGVMSCSDTPMDTPPINTLTTKGPVGPPSGPPGLPGITYYTADQSPILYENGKAGFIMTEGYCSFKVTIPRGYTGIKVTMNENEPFYTRYITKVESPGCMFFKWNKGDQLTLTGFKDPRDGPEYPAINVTVKIYSVVTKPVILYFNFTM